MPERKNRILVVDDDERNLRIIEAMLIPQGYDVLLAQNGYEALKIAREQMPDVILLDIMMPQIDGFEVAKQLKADEGTKIIPIVMVTALREVEDRVKALEAGADDFLSKPVEKIELRARVSSLLKVKAYNDYMRDYQKKLEAAVEKRTEQLTKAVQKLRLASLDTVQRLSHAAEYKDEDTGTHIKRMSNYAVAIARKMGLPDKTVETILYASPMHDIGKIGIPDRVLLKPGKLDPDEWEIMKTHTTIGASILHGSDAEFIQLAEVIALTHHEKWDGTGYPKGLKGHKIPIAGHITAIADVFDALVSKRPYKEAFPVEKAFQIIKDSRGTHFNPELVNVFFSIQQEILDIKEHYKSGSVSAYFQMAKIDDKIE